MVCSKQLHSETCGHAATAAVAWVCGSMGGLLLARSVCVCVCVRQSIFAMEKLHYLKMCVLEHNCIMSSFSSRKYTAT